MYNRLKEAFNCLNKEYRNNHFSPIIEDDFLARIYYHILKHNKELNSKIFLVLPRKLWVVSRTVLATYSRLWRHPSDVIGVNLCSLLF